MGLKESVDVVTIEAIEFEITSFSYDEDSEVEEAAAEIASDIGMHLSSLGTSCRGGRVLVTIGGRTWNSENFEL